eukprot:6709250-Prymnesium_polylepis.1
MVIQHRGAGHVGLQNRGPGVDLDIYVASQLFPIAGCREGCRKFMGSSHGTFPETSSFFGNIIRRRTGLSACKFPWYVRTAAGER